MGLAWGKPNPDRDPVSDVAALYGRRDYDWPQAWRRGRLTLPLCTAVLALSIPAGLLMISRGEVLPGVILAWCGASFTAPLLLLRPVQGRIRARVTDAALVFDQSRTALICLGICLPGITITSMLGVLMIALKFGLPPGFAAAAAVLTTISLIAWWILERRRQGNSGERGWPSVELRADGLLFRGLFSGILVAWVEDLRVLPIRNVVGVIVPGPTRARLTRLLNTDPAIVASAIHFYAQHPHARAELGTHLATDRVVRGDLSAEPR